MTRRAASQQEADKRVKLNSVHQYYSLQESRMATRLRSFLDLLDAPYLEDIEDWPDNHVCWLVEAFFNISKGRIPMSSDAAKYLDKHMLDLLAISRQRNYDKARRVLKRYAGPLIFVAIPPIIEHLRSKRRVKVDKEELLASWPRRRKPVHLPA